MNGINAEISKMIHITGNNVDVKNVITMNKIIDSDSQKLKYDQKYNHIDNINHNTLTSHPSMSA